MAQARRALPLAAACCLCLVAVCTVAQGSTMSVLELKPVTPATDDAPHAKVGAAAADHHRKDSSAMGRDATDSESGLASAAHEAAKRAKAADAEASKAEASLALVEDGAVTAAGAQEEVPRQQKSFISGDRFGNHHVYNDFGINHNRRRGNWRERHVGHWRNTADGRKQYICDYVDDPYGTGTHRRLDVVNNAWCDDEYLGYHFPVHYHDDRDVYGNGFGEHLGTVYGDDSVKPGVLQKTVPDRYGDFFHGTSPGYDWVEEHARGRHEPAITQYAYSTSKDKTYGDDGDKRQRPLYYMDWDSDGTRALDHTAAYGEEDFTKNGGDFAATPRGRTGLRARQQLLQKERRVARSLARQAREEQEQVNEARLAKEVGSLRAQVAHVKRSLHDALDKTLPKNAPSNAPAAQPTPPSEAAETAEATLLHEAQAQLVAQERDLHALRKTQRSARARARRVATLRHRHVTKAAQGRMRVTHGPSSEHPVLGRGGDSASSSRNPQSSAILDEMVGQVERSLKVDAKGHRLPTRRVAGGFEDRSARDAIRAATHKKSLKELRREMDEEGRQAQEQRAARTRRHRAWLEDQLAHGTGRLHALRRAARSQSARWRQVLSASQEAAGETAAPNMGRDHGCGIMQVTGSTAMLDDCDPLSAKMQPLIDAESQRLAAATAGNKGGVHWTSGDVPPIYDAIPMREVHGGYSGISDISFPADKVYPTLYKPGIGNPLFYPSVTPSRVGTKHALGPKSLHQTFDFARDDWSLRPDDARATAQTKAAEEEAKAEVLKKREMQVDEAHSEVTADEKKASVERAIGDRVMHDAVKEEDQESRTRLLKAATEEYEKAAAETQAANKAAAAVEAEDAHAAAPASVAAMDRAIGDQVVKDAMQVGDADKRARLLQAASRQYRKAAAEAVEEQGSPGAHSVAQQPRGQDEASAGSFSVQGAAAHMRHRAQAEGAPGIATERAAGVAHSVSLTMPASVAKGTVTIKFSDDESSHSSAGSASAAPSRHAGMHASGQKRESAQGAGAGEDALEVAKKLAATEKTLRAQAKALAVMEATKTAKVVSRNDKIQHTLAGVVDVSDILVPAEAKAVKQQIAAAAHESRKVDQELMLK